MGIFRLSATTIDSTPSSTGVLKIAVRVLHTKEGRETSYSINAHNQEITPYSTCIYYNIYQYLEKISP